MRAKEIDWLLAFRAAGGFASDLGPRCRNVRRKSPGTFAADQNAMHSRRVCTNGYEMTEHG